MFNINRTNKAKVKYRIISIFCFRINDEQNSSILKNNFTCLDVDVIWELLIKYTKYIKFNTKISIIIYLYVQII